MPAELLTRAQVKLKRPEAPRFDALPVAVRSALRLSGSAVPCGEGLRGVGWPETPTTRLASLAQHLAGGRIACFLTAAWVWGAVRSTGNQLAIAMPLATRRPLRHPSDVQFYELRLNAADHVQLDGLLVMTPERTVHDLLHQPGEFGVRERVACRLLAQFIPGGMNRIHAEVGNRRRPHRRLAQGRLEHLLARSAEC